MALKNWQPVIRCSAVIAATLLAVSAYAQQRSFNLPEQEATKSLPEFARQAGIQIAAPAEELKGVRTPQIKGEYDVREALRQLLKDTNLTVTVDANQMIVLRKEGLSPEDAHKSSFSAQRDKELRLAQAAGQDASSSGNGANGSSSSQLKEIEEIVVTA